MSRRLFSGACAALPQKRGGSATKRNWAECAWRCSRRGETTPAPPGRGAERFGVGRGPRPVRPGPAAHAAIGPVPRPATGALAAAATAMVLVGSPVVGGVAPVGAATLCGPTSSAPLPGTTSLETVEQAYWCIFAHYYSGPVLDGRALLAGAFAGFVDELNHDGLDAGAAEPSPTR